MLRKIKEKEWGCLVSAFEQVVETSTVCVAEVEIDLEKVEQMG